MPAKGSSLRHGNRHNVMGIKLHKRFMEATGISVSYSDFTSVIQESNILIRDIILNNPQGFKVPDMLGNLAVTKYKSKASTRIIDWGKTNKTGVRVYHNNFHTFGYKMRIQWYADTLAKCRNINIYKFIPDRLFARELAKSIFSGKSYNEFSYEYFKTKKIRIGRIIDKYELQKHGQPLQQD